MTKSRVFLVLFISISFVSNAADLIPFSSSLSANDTAKYFTFGGTQTEEFRDLALTADSGFILVGTTNGYGPGNSSIYVVRADKKGRHLWSSVLGGSNLDQGTAVLSLSDGGFLFAGSSNSAGAGGYDGYLAKTDGSGSKLWEKYIGGSDWDFINDMALLPDSSIIICGESYSYSSGGSDAWVVNLSKDGTIIWQRNYGSVGNDSFRGLSIYKDHIYLCGFFQGSDLDGYLIKLDFNGQLIFEKKYNQFGNDRINSICISPSSTVIMAGGSIFTDSLKSEFWLFETDTLGFTTGNLSYGISAEDDYMNSVLAKSNGDIIATGQKNPYGFGQKSTYTIEVNSAFVNFRSQSFGGPLDEEGFSILETPDNEIAIAGYTSSYGLGNRDACLLLIDTNVILDSMVYLPIITVESLSPIGISEYPDSRLNISYFPVPANEFIFISPNAQFEKLSMSIFSVDGRLLSEDELDFSTEMRIDISSLAPGLYLLRLKNHEGKSFTGKIIKN